MSLRLVLHSLKKYCLIISSVLQSHKLLFYLCVCVFVCLFFRSFVCSFICLFYLSNLFVYGLFVFVFVTSARGLCFCLVCYHHYSKGNEVICIQL